jgi:RNA polymerase sigma factor (sigma-70 family)
VRAHFPAWARADSSRLYRAVVSVGNLSGESAESRFRHYYESYYRMLLAYALRRSRDPADAHDAVAETFLVMWRRFRDAPATEEEVPLWLHGIIRRVMSNHDRSRERRGRLFARLSEIQEQSVAAEEQEGARERVASVFRALAQLGSADREILLLSSWDNLKIGEIANVLGCSENAAALRLHRARRRLTEVYEKENSEAGHRRSKPPALRQPADPEE